MSDHEGRAQSSAGRLAKVGLSDPAAAWALLESVSEFSLGSELVDELALAADPDLAVATLVSLWQAADAPLRVRLLEDAGLRARLLLVVGASEALGEFVIRQPSAILALADDGPVAQPLELAVVKQDLLGSVQAAWQSGRWVSPRDEEPLHDSLKRAYKKWLLLVAARDLSGAASLEETAFALSVIADAVVEAGLALAWAAVNRGEPASRLSVIAMGKCGGRELNYISDVDVVFVAESAGGDGDFLAEATRVAARVIQICEQPTGEGSIWQLDPALRPEGKAGALVRTLEGHVSYYERWAETWEFQALLKAREMAGDAELGHAYVEAISPFVWQAAARDNFVSDVQQMRQRVVENIPGKEQSRQLKLGVGGLRDIEFAVQLLQLVHGRSDAMLRSSNTLQALEALATWGYVGREDAAQMAEIYRFERTLEHRIQMFKMRRTHLVPDSEPELRRLGRSLGLRNDPAQSLEETWAKYRREARRLHEKLFFRPLLQAVVRLDAADARLTPEAAIRHLTALSTGVSRRAAIQRTLLPVILQWMAETPTPDAGLLAFRQVSDSLGATPWYLRLLRDESLVAERLAKLLSVSPYFTSLLMGAPEAVAMLADDEQLAPRSRASLHREMEQVAGRQTDFTAAIAGIRSIRQRELIRVCAADLVGLLDVAAVSRALSDIAQATIEVALGATLSDYFNGAAPSLKLAVIGLGRLGGRELNYGSDADVCMVYDELAPSAGADAVQIISKLTSALSAPSHDPALVLDLDLRPEGRQGAIARTLASYAAYYERWSLTWESQALLRARFLAGDEELGRRFESLIDGLRYPAAGLTELELREIRRIKARVETERMPRGAVPQLQVKLGPGGITDVEWTVQLAQLRYGGALEELRTTGTLDALHAMAESALVTIEEAQLLESAWRFASQIRNGLVLVSNRPSDQIPGPSPELSRLAFVCGLPNGEELAEQYRRGARRARAVMEKHVFEKVD